MGETETELAVPAQESIPTVKHLEATGIIVAASPNGEASHEALQTAFDSIGMRHLAPDQRTLKEALRVALVQNFSKKNRRVAPCGEGYEVVEERKIQGTLRNDHLHLLSAYVEKDVLYVDTNQFSIDGVVHTDEDLRLWVSEARRQVDGTEIGKSISAVCSALHGVSIRDAGGAYWLPNSTAERFMELVAALNKAGRPVRIAVMDTANTPRSIESTITRIENMVEGTCADIVAAIQSGECGEKALDGKSDLAAKLAAQLEQYESVLSVGLDTLKEKVMKVKSAAVTAAIQANNAKQQQLRDRRMAAAQASADSLA